MNESITESQVSEIVKKVVTRIASETAAAENKSAAKEAKEEKSLGYTSTSYNGRAYFGIFSTMEEAIQAAAEAYKKIRAMSVEDKEKIITQIRKLILDDAEIMAKMGVEETGMGRVDHKTLKHILVANKTPGTEDLVTTAKTGDFGLTLTETAPLGIIGSITPSTNPSETVLCNSIGMFAAGNAVVFNPHPHATMTANYAVDLVNRASIACGGPANLVCSVAKPTMQSADTMVKSPLVRMLVCTGGPGVVKAMLSSGKKAIGAGAGNPPVIVDDTADIKKAAKDIIDGCTFDNNLPCIAEKEVFVFDNVRDELTYYMTQNGAYLINDEEAAKVLKTVMVETEKGLTINKNWVGRDAKKILAAVGIEVGDDIRCIIYETTAEHPFVQHELMMPILPIVAVNDIDEAIEKAVQAEHGNRHTAHMHSKNVDNLTKFARAVETTIFVKNAPSYAGIGFGGEGHTTFTIAGPTGEGLTSARSFTRLRRCVMTESFRII